MKDNFKIDNRNTLICLLAAILIVIFHNFNIDWYLKNIVIPFGLLLISVTVILQDNKEINKKAYFMLIPITLTLISDVIIKIDLSNKIINVFLLPFLIFTFFILLVNKNYKISLNNFPLLFKLFPNDLFKNIKLLKPNITKEKNNKIVNVILGLIIGVVVSSVILLLLVSADDYFDAFLSKIIFIYDIDISSIILLIVSFIVLFSISINSIKAKNIKMNEEKYKIIDKTIVTTVLSVINFVFLLFLISEISKLCGNFLKIPKGYIYSSYAREGFFQLLFVTLINYFVIAYLMYKTKDVYKDRTVKILILSLVCFSVLLIFNSYYRMFLYIRQFGFTILRLQVVLFLLMELILFIIISKKLVNEIKNDGVIFLAIISTFYVINLYLCNDWFIKIISNVFKPLKGDLL